MSKQNKSKTKVALFSKDEFQSMVRNEAPHFWLYFLAFFVFLGIVNMAITLYLQRIGAIAMVILPTMIGAIYAIYMHQDSKRTK